MGFKSIIGAICTCLAVVSFNVSAALVGRLAATPGGTDYQAYYDTEADLTWLADANAFGDSMNWTDANAWAAQLSVGGNDTWRLASSLNSDDTGPCGIGYNCTDSEMGNLFYNVLGGTASTSIVTTHNSNYDLFSNVQFGYYWSATEDTQYTTDNSEAWEFGMHYGDHATTSKASNGYAWAVQSGDVSAVPVPAAVWLFGSGLIGLIGLARRKSNA